MAKLTMHRTDRFKEFEQYQYIFKIKDRLSLHGYVRFGTLGFKSNRQWLVSIYVVTNDLTSIDCRNRKYKGHLKTLKAAKENFKEYMEAMYG